MSNLNTLNGSLNKMDPVSSSRIATGTPLVANMGSGTAAPNSAYRGDGTWVSLPFTYTSSAIGGYVTYTNQGSINASGNSGLLYYSSNGTAQDLSEFPFTTPCTYGYDENGNAISIASSSNSVQLVIGSDTGAPAFAGATNITQINTANAPSFAMTFVANPTANVVTTNTTMVWGRTYIVNSTSLVTLTLPTTFPIGATLRVVGINTGGWTIAQNAGQNIRVSSTSVSTTGTGGSVSSNNSYDSVCLICTVANTSFTIMRNSLSSGLVVV